MTTPWMKRNLQQRAGTNTFPTLFLFPPKIILLLCLQGKTGSIIPFLVVTAVAVVIRQKSCTHFFLPPFGSVRQVSAMQKWQTQNSTSADANGFKGCFYTWSGMARLQCSWCVRSTEGGTRPKRIHFKTQANIHGIFWQLFTRSSLHHIFNLCPFLIAKPVRHSCCRQHCPERTASL